MLTHEVAHHRDAGLVLHDVDAHTVACQPLLFAHERLILADHDRGNAIQHDGTTAHRAGRQRRVEDTRPVNAGGLTAGILERVHFAMQDCAAPLDAAVVTAADDLATV